ncbi:hypothetical protein AMECASPLE_034284, partial [Ameca splendens]
FHFCLTLGVKSPPWEAPRHVEGLLLFCPLQPRLPVGLLVLLLGVLTGPAVSSFFALGWSPLISTKGPSSNSSPS